MIPHSNSSSNAHNERDVPGEAFYEGDDSGSAYGHPQWRDAQSNGTQYAFVLLKKPGVFGPIYYLEKRNEDDRDYPGRIHLYGGERRNGETTVVDTACREVMAETGLVITKADLRLLVSSNTLYTDRDGPAEVHIFAYDFGWWANVGSRQIEKYQSGMAEDDKKFVGPPIRIQRLFRTWYFKWNWKQFTPMAAYALLADWDHRGLRRNLQRS